LTLHELISSVIHTAAEPAPESPRGCGTTKVYHVERPSHPGVPKHSHATPSGGTRVVPERYHTGMHLLEIEPDQNGVVIVHFRHGWLRLKVKGWCKRDE